MKNNYLLKKGSILGVRARYDHQGWINELTPNRIFVQLDSPLTLILSREIPEGLKEEPAYAVEIKGEYYATQEGLNSAISLLIKLSEEEEILLDRPYRIADVIKEYREKTKDNTSLSDKNRILSMIREKHFPELKEIVFTEKLVDELYDYLTKVEGIEDIYTL